jgi:hypothetical protein
VAASFFAGAEMKVEQNDRAREREGLTCRGLDSERRLGSGAVDAQMFIGKVHIIEWLRDNDRRTGWELFGEVEPMGIISNPRVDAAFYRVATRGAAAADTMRRSSAIESSLPMSLTDRLGHFSSRTPLIPSPDHARDSDGSGSQCGGEYS